MDLNDIPFGEIIAKNVDLGPINNSVKVRAEMLASQLNPKAAAEVTSEAEGLQWSVSAQNNSVIFEITEANIPFINQLANGPSIPVAGGDNGTAHNPDGSTYQSNVPKVFYGNPLESLALPKADLMNEIQYTGKLFASDACNSSAQASNGEIKQLVLPRFSNEVAKIMKGGL